MGALKDKFINWEIGLKDGLSSGISKNSSVYITIGRGILTETYFPSPDNIVIHSLRFFINGLIEESTLPYQTEMKDLYAPIYNVKSKYGTLTIEKEFLIDPENSILHIKYKFSEYVNGSFKIFPFLKDILNYSKNSITIKTETSFLKIVLDTDFKYERVNDFLILNVSNIKKTQIKIAFGRTINEAEETFKNSSDPNKIEEKFVYQWKTYLNILNLENKNNLFLRSVINIKSMEDKKHHGAVVASLAMPWGSKFSLSEKNGYHLIWARDLFYTALAMRLAGDEIFAHDSLEYMLKYNKRPDGSFKQNATIEGEERWNSTQMDQIAFPIILAYKLKRFDLLKELKKSADYIAKKGPYTEQERWEEIGGFSPYSMSLQSLALRMYGLMCKNSGSLEWSKYLEKAEEFKKMINQYTFTTKGFFSTSYFTRISEGNPDTNKKVLKLKGAKLSPKEMISADFLYLVFTRLFNPSDKKIINSLEVVDKELKVNTPNGVSFYRYNNDIYGFDNPDNPKGKLWIILTCERGIFEVMRGNDANQYLRSVENFATDTYLLPEQVAENGKPTESATPLAWSHALYIILHEKINKNIHFLFQ